MFVCRKNTYKKKSSDFSANSTIQLYGSRNSTREELNCWKDLVIKDREGRENQSSVEPTLIPWLSRQFPSPTWDSGFLRGSPLLTRGQSQVCELGWSLGIRLHQSCIPVASLGSHNFFGTKRLWAGMKCSLVIEILLSTCKSLGYIPRVAK